MKYFGEGGSEDVQQLLKLEDAMNTVYGTRIDFRNSLGRLESPGLR